MSSRDRIAGPVTRSKAVFGDSTNKTSKAESVLQQGSRTSLSIKIPLTKTSKPPTMKADKVQSSLLPQEQPRKMKSLHLPTRGTKRGSSPQLQWLDLTPTQWINNLNEKAKEAEEQECDGKSLSKLSGPRTPHGLLPSSACASGGSYDPWRDLYSPMNGFDTLPPEMRHSLSKVDPGGMPVYWDFGTLPPSPTIDRIRLLALAIEDQTMFADLRPALEQIRNHFTFSQSSARQHGEFDRLCDETIRRLISLLSLLVNSSSGRAVASHTATLLTSNVSHNKARSSPSTPNKAAFQQHMTNWLRANWINPYPDEAVAHQLAYETGETPHVVNTWLVNARSRRWRPSILRAFDLKRPSEFLWEDSINLFDENPLRSIDEDMEVEEVHKRIRLD